MVIYTADPRRLSLASLITEHYFYAETFHSSLFPMYTSLPLQMEPSLPIIEQIVILSVDPLCLPRELLSSLPQNQDFSLMRLC